MKLSDLTLREPVCIRPQMSLISAVAELAKHNTGVLIVMTEPDQVHGVISERDIIRKVAASGPDILKQRIEDIILTPAISLSTERSLEDAAIIMRKRRIRHVLVMDGTQPKGMVTARDILTHLHIQLRDL